jgi:hypothetical protein
MCSRGLVLFRGLIRRADGQALTVLRFLARTQNINQERRSLFNQRILSEPKLGNGNYLTILKGDTHFKAFSKRAADEFGVEGIAGHLDLSAPSFLAHKPNN